MDNYVYVDPFIEPISLDAFVCPDDEDGDAVCHPVADSNPDIEELRTIAEAPRAFAVSWQT